MFRNFSFARRDSVIADMHSSFSNSTDRSEVHDFSRTPDAISIGVTENTTDLIFRLLQRLAGIGETQCALEYYHRFKEVYDACF